MRPCYAFRQEQTLNPRPIMPTLRTIPGQIVTVGDGPRRFRPSDNPLRDLELGGAETQDIYLDTPPLTPTLLASVSARYAMPLMEALHQALDAAEAGVIVDVAAVFDEVKAKL